MPLDLRQVSLETIQPEAGRDGPRLWVRRLVIWNKPGEVLREVSLRPGLNIIWSPDSGDADSPMGHGGGKTSLCRLLRYCLGEDSFGSDEQRYLIGDKLPDAHVGAEIMIGGQPWIVVRPIGNARGRHFCQHGGELDTAFHSDMANTGIAPLRKAIVEATMSSAVVHMPVPNKVDDGWEVALAWLSRDQECRLIGPLDWRAPDTDSRSPARALSAANRLVVVRLLLNALQPDEIKAAEEAHKFEQERAAAAQRCERVKWMRDDLARGLSEIFGGDATDESEVPDLWRHNAEAELKREEDQLDPDAETKLATARTFAEEKREDLHASETRLAVIDSELGTLGELLRVLENNHAVAATRVSDVENPLCLSCGQPITANEQVFIAERIAERDALGARRDEGLHRRTALEAEQDALKFTVAAARQEYERRAAAADRLLHSLVDQTQRMSSSKGHVMMTKRYRMLVAEIAQERTKAAKAEESRDRAKRRSSEFRRASEGVLSRLSEYFDAVIQRLLTDDATGTVTFEDTSVRLRVKKRGSLSTAAVDSLKVVAFDLAALILTIEGSTQLPGFLLHDSPREADLGLSIYYRLFELVRRLEDLRSTPAFQYVVTTTTKPPPQFQQEPWMRLQLRSAPAEARLFAMDL